jgi:hypothetical protein
MIVLYVTGEFRSLALIPLINKEKKDRYVLTDELPAVTAALIYEEEYRNDMEFIRRKIFLLQTFMEQT